MAFICGAEKMLRNPTIRLSLIVMLIFSGVAIAYRQMNMFGMMGMQSNSIVVIKSGEQLKSGSGEEKGLGEDDDRDYFGIFKLITNLIPGKRAN